MKFLGALTLLAAGFATAATSVPYDEAHEWRQCTVNMLNEFGRDLAGDKAACHLWTCLHDKAETFNRGGVITRISNALTPFCLAVQTFPDVSRNKKTGNRYLLTVSSSGLAATPVKSRPAKTEIGCGARTIYLMALTRAAPETRLHAKC